MEQLKKLIKDRKDITLEWADEVIDQILESGRSSSGGIRGLENTIDRQIVESIANSLLHNVIKKSDTVTIKFEKNQFVIHKN